MAFAFFFPCATAFSGVFAFGACLLALSCQIYTSSYMPREQTARKSGFGACFDVFFSYLLGRHEWGGGGARGERYTDRRGDRHVNFLTTYYESLIRPSAGSTLIVLTLL